MKTEQGDYLFTSEQLLAIINNWADHFSEPISGDEYDFLTDTFGPEHGPFTYGLDDPESLILEALSEYLGENWADNKIDPRYLGADGIAMIYGLET